MQMEDVNQEYLTKGVKCSLKEEFNVLVGLIELGKQFVLR